MRKLEELLSQEEANFVRAVYRSLGSKHPYPDQIWEDDGSEYGTLLCLWEKPEKLGLIECVGSYKWRPTTRLDIGVLNGA